MRRPENFWQAYYAPPQGGIKRYCDPSVCLSSLGYRHIGCLQLAGHQTCADCGPKLPLAGGISSRHPQGGNLFHLLFTCEFWWTTFTHKNFLTWQFMFRLLTVLFSSASEVYLLTYLYDRHLAVGPTSSWKLHPAEHQCNSVYCLKQN